MIIECFDILNQEKSISHVTFPPNATFRDIFASVEMLDKSNLKVREAIDGLKCVLPNIMEVKVNGVRCDNWLDARLSTTDKIAIYIKPADILTWTILGTSITVAQALAAVAAVASIVSFIVGLVTRPKPPKQRTGESQGSPSFSWTGMQTSIGPGGAVPVIYGSHVSAGQLLSMNIDASRQGGQLLSMLIGLGEGPISEVGSITINDVPIEQFPDASWDWRHGTEVQPTMFGFDDIRNTFFDGAEIIPPNFGGDWITYRTAGNQIDAVDLIVTAPGGLIHIDAKTGRQEPMAVNYQIQYKDTVTSAWTDYGVVFWSLQTLQEVWNSTRLNFGYPSAWDIRIKIYSTIPSPPIQTEDVYQIVLKNVTEITNSTQTYSSTALLAVRAIASSQLQGGTPTIKAFVVGREVNQYIYSDGVGGITPYAWVNSATSNPAWNIVDYMTNSRYGMGAFIQTTDLDLTSFKEFADYCDEQVVNEVGSFEASHHLDLIMDARRSHWQQVNDLLSNYESALIYSNGKYKVVTDKDTPIRHVFHAGDTVPDKTSIRLGVDPLRPNQVNVDFANSAINYNRDQIYIQDDSLVGGTDPVRDFDMSLLGITRQSEVKRVAAFHLSRRRIVAREIAWTTALEGLAVEPGDMAQVGVLMTDYNAGLGGRALGGSTTRLDADREVLLPLVLSAAFQLDAFQNDAFQTFEDFGLHAEYELFVQHTATDTVERRIISNAPGTWISLTTATPFAQPVAAGDIWAIGISSQDLFTVRVKNISRNNDGTHDIVGEQFTPFFVNTPPLTPVTVPDFIRSSANDAFVFFEPPPQPLAIGAFEEVILGNDGTTTSRVNMNLTMPPRFEAGVAPTAPSSASVTLASSIHNPTPHSIDGNELKWTTGSAYLSAPRRIISWAGSPTMVASIAPPYAATEMPHSGDQYSFENKHGDLAGFDAYTRTQSETTYKYAKTFTGATGAIDVANQGQDVFIEIIPFSSRGTRNAIGPWIIPIDIIGDTIPPDNVPNYSIQQITQNTLVKHTWSFVTDFDVDYYEIRDGLSWASATFVGRAPSFNEYFDQTLFDAGSHHFLIKAFDNSGNESVLASPFNVFLFPRGNVQGLVFGGDLIETRDELTMRISPRYLDIMQMQDSLSTVVMRRGVAPADFFKLFPDTVTLIKYKGFTPVDAYTYVDTLTTVVTHN